MFLDVPRPGHEFVGIALASTSRLASDDLLEIGVKAFKCCRMDKIEGIENQLDNVG